MPMHNLIKESTSTLMLKVDVIHKYSYMNLGIIVITLMTRLQITILRQLASKPTRTTFHITTLLIWSNASLSLMVHEGADLHCLERGVTHDIGKEFEATNLLINKRHFPVHLFLEISYTRSSYDWLKWHFYSGDLKDQLANIWFKGHTYVLRWLLVKNIKCHLTYDA